jgi:hypothetical protein
MDDNADEAQVIASSMSTSPPAANVWCVSDVHADYSENMAWIVDRLQHSAIH